MREPKREKKKSRDHDKKEPKYSFPTETIDLPSGGKLYGKDSPLYDGKIVFSISYKDYAQNEGEVISSTTDEIVLILSGSLPSDIFGTHSIICFIF